MLKRICGALVCIDVVNLLVYLRVSKGVRVNISEKIKKVIKDKGVKDSEFAHTTGISIDRIRNLCQGKVKKLQPHEKDAIRNAYGVSQEWWESDTSAMYMAEVEPIRSPVASYTVRVPLSSSGPIKAELLQPSAEWIVLTTIAISEADWLPDTIKLDRSAQAGLALRLYQLLGIHLGTTDAKWEWMMNNRDALQHALHFVFNLDQMESLLEKDAQSKKADKVKTE